VAAVQPPEQGVDRDYLPERAIAGEAQDRFGRAGFARRLADAVLSRDGTRARAVVVGLVGYWGNGKSSILNLLRTNWEGAARSRSGSASNLGSSPAGTTSSSRC
jgi:ribosome biogenesis GTPase A